MTLNPLNFSDLANITRRDDFPDDDLAARRRHIDGLLEAERLDAMRRHPSNTELCGDQGCGRPSPEDCHKCTPRMGLRVIRGGLA